MERVYSNSPNILLMVDLDRAYERGLVMGILKYAHMHGPFNFMRRESVVLGELHTLNMSKIKQWGPQGVFLREGHDIKGLKSLGLPTIYMPSTVPDSNSCNILTDDYTIGSKAANYLLSKGLANFAYCGLDERHYWSIDRRAGFVDTIEDEGFAVDTCDMLDSSGSIEQWISGWNLPMGLMVCTDDCALKCYNAIHAAGMSIPEEVAIVGVGNDEIVCNFSEPPMSSVKLNLEAAGFMAMDKMRYAIGGVALEGDVLVDAVDVVERQSSNFFSVEDEVVSSAMRFIYENRNEPIGVEDVVQACPVSRRVLYRRFKQSLGRSIAEEIRMVRMNHAAQIILHTNFSLPDIADQLGFDSPHNFSRAFLREKGITPHKYRLKYSAFG